MSAALSVPRWVRERVCRRDDCGATVLVTPMRRTYAPPDFSRRSDRCVGIAAASVCSLPRARMTRISPIGSVRRARAVGLGPGCQRDLASNRRGVVGRRRDDSRQPTRDVVQQEDSIRADRAQARPAPAHLRGVRADRWRAVLGRCVRIAAASPGWEASAPLNGNDSAGHRSPTSGAAVFTPAQGVRWPYVICRMRRNARRRTTR
jgi:hypothetical protein